MLPFQPNVENIFHARLPVDSSNCFSTSSSDLVSILSASDSAWVAPSLQMAFVGVVKPGGGGVLGQHRPPPQLIDKILAID